MTDRQILVDGVLRALAALGTAAHAADNLSERGELCGKLAAGNLRTLAAKLADLMIPGSAASSPAASRPDDGQCG